MPAARAPTAASGQDHTRCGRGSGLWAAVDLGGGGLVAGTDDDLVRAVSIIVSAVLTEGFQSAFLAGAGFAALGLLATLFLVRTRDSRAHVALGAEVAVESEG